MTQNRLNKLGTLLIRADAGHSLGVGHVMRCIALGQAWREEGGEVIFLSYCESSVLRERIISEGFVLIQITEAYPSPHDIEQLLLTAAARRNKCWIVLDGYHFDTEYQNKIRKNGLRLIVVDDMNHLAHYHADILLNQNIYAPEMKYSCDVGTTELMGCGYTLIRREFTNLINIEKRIPTKAKNILVTMGGSDSANITAKVIEAVEHIDDNSLHVKIIIGFSNQHVASLKQAVSKSCNKFELFDNITQMPPLMQWADVAITAAGSTCWELLTMGVPFGTLILADNQERISNSLKECFDTPSFGWAENISASHLAEKIKIIFNDHQLRQSLSDNGKKLVSGHGARKIIEKMQVTK